MINIRGNQYSKRHLTLDPSDTRFWDFSHHESAMYDYPATIDYIIGETGEPQLFFAGFSLGTTQYFILLSERPEYNRKIKAGFMIGPTAVGKNADNVFVTLAPLAPALMRLSETLGKKGFIFEHFLAWDCISTPNKMSQKLQLVKPQRFFTGFSHWATKYFILLSERPEYNRIIMASFIIGPTAVRKNANKVIETKNWVPLWPTKVCPFKFRFIE